VKVRQERRVIQKALCLALGITAEGKKECLGMWLSENEGAKLSLQTLRIFISPFLKRTQG